MIKITLNIKELFEKSVVAFGTCNSDYIPNVIAVACCKVVADNQVLITDNFFNKTRHNLSANNHVSLSFWNPVDGDNNWGYQFKGTAQVFTEGKWKKMVDSDPDNVGLAHKAAILVTITEIWDLATPKLICKE
ncbi:MAG: pyridoxamine 5'-phosphate oxidase family protein [Candidatus Shapirobacteria bacterium]